MTYPSQREQIANHYPPLRRASVPARNTTGDEDDDYDDVWPPKVGNSVVKYQQGNTRYEFQPQTLKSPVTPRRSAPAQRAREDGAAPRKKRGLIRAHPVLWLGFGMLLMLALWQGGMAWNSWWTLHQDDVTYGRPRTFQMDMVVGHSDSSGSPSHFIALNFKNSVEIIEFQGGDPAKARVYSGPHLFGPDSDLAPVTLSFKDTTGSGRLDMIVHVQGADIIYLNQKVNTVWQFVEQQ